MTYEEMQTKIRTRLDGTDIYDLQESPDFQCDQSGGFPVMLFACFDKGIAWLEPNYDMVQDHLDLVMAEQDCADFGIRACHCAEDYNNILRELGKDAIDSAELPEQDGGQTLC